MRQHKSETAAAYLDADIGLGVERQNAPGRELRTSGPAPFVESALAAVASHATVLGYSIKDPGMSHTIRNKTGLLARVRRIRGQVEALERALEAEKGCTEIMQQIAAFRGAANGLMTEVIEEHVHTHVARPSSTASRSEGADELIEIVRAYLR